MLIVKPMEVDNNPVSDDFNWQPETSGLVIESHSGWHVCMYMYVTTIDYTHKYGTVDSKRIINLATII